MRKGIIAWLLASSMHLKYWYLNLSSSHLALSSPFPCSPCPRLRRLSLHSPIRSLSPALDILRVDARCTLLNSGAETRLIAAVKVLVLQVEGVNMAWEIAVLFISVRQRTVLKRAWMRWGGGEADPRQVRQMLMRRSAPHPAIYADFGVSVSPFWVKTEKRDKFGEQKDPFAAGTRRLTSVRRQFWGERELSAPERRHETRICGQI